ncbi:expressed unknown protein [Seminavis robusta]|uniref:Arrestin-like N-terminal domain-containing protein n=1 Tax=Seminavis robusta TaxID=568900 RepID=A0A9N8HQS8_9STRA|nr:expressed unknown protein [Seminavis robusta]|eukprot:Sro1229_g254460.1 n/a (400) ;mRNA; r:7387-8586
MITGKLVIDNTRKPLKHVRCSGISMYFRGKEYSLVGYDMTIRNVDDGSLMKERHYKRDTQEFYRLELKIPKELTDTIVEGGRIHPGKYEIPFSFNLPSKLPGSLRVFSGDYKSHKESDRAEISYCLRAKLEESGHLYAYQTRKTITVAAAPQRLERVPHFCGADDTGISVGASFTHVAPGQKPVISISIDKNDELVEGAEVKSLKMSILQATTWKADTLHKGKDAVPFGMKFSQKRESQEIKDLNLKGYIDIEFPIPKVTSLWNTTEGQLLSVMHEIEVRIIMRHGTYATEYTFSIPIKMAPPGSETLLLGKEVRVVTAEEKSIKSKSSRGSRKRKTAKSVKAATTASFTWKQVVLNVLCLCLLYYVYLHFDTVFGRLAAAPAFIRELADVGTALAAFS